jgi:hypothetical protein
MVDEVPKTTISADDVERLSEKLAAWADSLSEQEQNVLRWVIKRAQATPEDDTHGYLNQAVLAQPLHQFQTPMAAQLGRAAGFTSRTSSPEVTLTWMFHAGARLQRGIRTW